MSVYYTSNYRSIPFINEFTSGIIYLVVSFNVLAIQVSRPILFNIHDRLSPGSLILNYTVYSEVFLSSSVIA